MIFIKTATNSETRNLVLWVKGHAGAAEEGRDIICAAASMLAQTVAQEAINMGARHQLSKPAHVEIERGDTVVSIFAKDDIAYIEALHLLHVAEVGFSLLAHHYPEYVDFTKVTRRNAIT